MTGRIYINQTGPENVNLGFTASPSDLTRKDNCYGFAFLKTLEHLGLEAEVDPQPYQSAGLNVTGTVETVREHVPELQHHIGVIARYSAQRSKSLWLAHEGEWVGRMLGGLVQHSIPGLPEDASLMYTVGTLVYPFAQETKNDGVIVHYARQGMDDIVKNEDGSVLGSFSARDIGGLLIGADGCPAREQYSFSVRVSNEDIDAFALLAEAKGSKLGEELRQSLHRFVINPDKTPVTPTPTKRTYVNAQVNFNRVDLEQLQGYSEYFAGGATLGDLIRNSVQESLDEAKANPELLEKMSQIDMTRRTAHAFKLMN